MKLIIEIRRHGDDEDAQHLVFTKFPVTIGRGFDNDIIVNDAYVSAHHLQIDFDGRTCQVSDPGSENGFTVNGHPPKARHMPVKSGDALGIGLTEVRIYKPDHTVARAMPLLKDSPIFKWVAHPLNVWICFLLAVAATVYWAWLEIWVTDEEGLALVGAAAGTIGVIVLWSALWSVGGRLAHHRAHFKSHVTLICLYVLAGTVAWFVEVYTDFLTNEDGFAQIVTYSINFSLLALLLYGSLKLATRMSRRRRKVLAGFFSFGVMAGIFIFSIVSAKNFTQQPIYPATLEPYLTQLAPTQPVSDFIAGNDKLFETDTFAHAEIAKAPAKTALK